MFRNTPAYCVIIYKILIKLNKVVFIIPNKNKYLFIRKIPVT